MIDLNRFYYNVAGMRTTPRWASSPDYKPEKNLKPLTTEHKKDGKNHKTSICGIFPGQMFGEGPPEVGLPPRHTRQLASRSFFCFCSEAVRLGTLLTRRAGCVKACRPRISPTAAQATRGRGSRHLCQAVSVQHCLKWG